MSSFERGAALLVLSLASASTHAFEPEQDWRLLNHSNSYTSKQDAVNYMHSLASENPAYPYLNKEMGVTAMSENYEVFTYGAEKIEPNTSNFGYYDANRGGGIFSTEQAAVENSRSTTDTAPQCGPVTAVPSSGWTVWTTHFGGVEAVGRRTYTFTRYTYVPSTQSCTPSTFNGLFERSRSVTCPSPYAGENPAPGCYISFTAQIQGVRSNCESCQANRGNPGNALTGDKSEIATDYRGPFGLVLRRYYHSKSLDATNGMGAGWSNNYQSKVILSGSQVTGLIRSDGNRESMSYLGGSPTAYISRAGTGTIAKQISGTLYKVFLADGSIESYDGSGTLTSIADPAGRSSVLTYTNGRLTSVTGPFGHTLLFNYTPDAHLSSVTLPDGHAVAYGYTANNLTSVTYPDATSVSYQYESSTFPNNLTGITDESLARYATFGIDSAGRITSTEHAGGVQRYTFAYGSGSTQVTDPLGTVETLSYTTTATLARRLTQVSKPGQTQTYVVPSASVDTQRRVTQQTDANGNVTTFAYSTYAMTSRTDASGTARARTTNYTYLNNDSQRPLSITEPNRTTTFTYDASGTNVLTRTVTDTSVTPNVSRTWTFTYDGAGHVLTEDGPRTDVSDVTTYTYYSCTTGYQCGQLHTVTNAVSQVTSYDG